MWLDVWLFQTLHSLAGMSDVSDFLIVFFAEYFPFLAAAVYAVLLYRSNARVVQKMHAFSIALTAGLIARVSVIVFHPLLPRVRPYLEFGFDPLVMERSLSFPSGHAAFFFAFATGVYLHNRKWGKWFFVCAVIIGIARVAAGVHYPTDIIGGALLGICVAYILVRGIRAIGTQK